MKQWNLYHCIPYTPPLLPYNNTHKLELAVLYRHIPWVSGGVYIPHRYVDYVNLHTKVMLINASVVKERLYS